MNPPAAITRTNFEELFRLHYQALCRSAYLIIQDKAVAEDIVQDTFLSLWDKRETLQIDEGIKSYLYRAGINRALNHLRKQKNQALRERFFHEETANENTSADQAIRFQETDRRIQELIAALPPACRTVFVLSRYENMSYREIAGSLEISVNTVENHMSKALKFLRKYLVSIFLFFFVSQ